MMNGNARERTAAPLLLVDQLVAWSGARAGLDPNRLGRVLRRTASEVRDILDGRTPQRNGRIAPVSDVITVEAEIRQRIAAAPPSAPCWRCGARTGCGHQ